MADIYEASKENTTASKREALAALARGGTAERDAFLAAQEAQKGDQSRVMAEIMARATKLGATGAGAEMVGAAAPGFDRRSQALIGAQGSAETALGQISAANSNYFDQVNAAVPIMKARTDEINAAAKLKAEQEEADRQLELQLKQLALMTAAEKARGGGGGGAGDLSDSELKNRLMGAAAVQRATQPAQAPKRIMGLKVPQLSQEASARRIGVEAGIDPNRVFGLLPNAKPPAKKAPPKSSQTAHRSNVIARVQEHASPKTAGLILNIVAEASNLAKALNFLSEETDKDLRAAGISRTAVDRWLRDYYAV